MHYLVFYVRAGIISNDVAWHLSSMGTSFEFPMFPFLILPFLTPPHYPLIILISQHELDDHIISPLPCLHFAHAKLILFDISNSYLSCCSIVAPKCKTCHSLALNYFSFHQLIFFTLKSAKPACSICSSFDLLFSAHLTIIIFEVLSYHLLAYLAKNEYIIICKQQTRRNYFLIICFMVFIISVISRGLKADLVVIEFPLGSYVSVQPVLTKHSCSYLTLNQSFPFFFPYYYYYYYFCRIWYLEVGPSMKLLLLIKEGPDPSCHLP